MSLSHDAILKLINVYPNLPLCSTLSESSSSELAKRLLSVSLFILSQFPLDNFIKDPIVNTISELSSFLIGKLDSDHLHLLSLQVELDKYRTSEFSVRDSEIDRLRLLLNDSLTKYDILLKDTISKVPGYKLPLH